MKNLFGKKSFAAAPSKSSQIVERLQQQLNGSATITPKNAGLALSMESIGEDASHGLNLAAGELSTAIESIAIDLGIEKLMTQAQVNAGTMAGILSGNFKAFLNHKPEFPSVSTESIGVVNSINVADAVSGRSYSLEAYDERENRNATVYSIAYNMQAARQDEFGETFFPTIVLSPDNVGFGITVDLMMVFNGVTRNISGTFEDFKKKNIIRAVADPTVLQHESTAIIPVNRAQSVSKFVAPAIVPPYAVLLEGQSIQTAPLATGVKVDLLGISQNDALLSTGTMDQTDTIDPSIILSNAYVSFTAGTDKDVLKFNVGTLPLSNFTYSTQNNYRVMTLNFASTSILINLNTKQFNGAALVALAGVVTNDFIVRVEVQMSGSVNIETGETSVFGNMIHVHSIQDSDGVQLDLTAGAAAAIATIVNTGVIAGYDVKAYRTNMNRRQRGQFIDVTKYTQLYNVPLRCPITTLHPINTDGTTDSSDVQALITATRIRTSNEAVGALISSANILAEYVDARDFAGAGPDVLGVGRFFVRPTYYTETIDIAAIVNSISSADRAADTQAALVNKIRNYAYQMYRNSEYKAAADAFAGGISATPTVVIGTDPVIARYLTVSGDLRTLGGEFDVRIVSTLDYRMTGKIAITFGCFDEGRNTDANPLSFGNMIWSPELVLTANISRTGTISKETVVQPKFLFVTHLPVLTMLEITNIPNLWNKLSIDFHSV